MRTSLAVAGVVVALSLISSATAEPEAGPWTHRVLSASSPDGLAWTRDDGVRLEHASVPCAVVDGDRMLLYFVDADRGPGRFESTGCAASKDGLAFEKLPLSIDGLPSRKALDPCVMRDPAGRLRLYYLASDAQGGPDEDRAEHRIHVAESADGVNFRESGLVFRSPGLVDPDVFVFKDRWFMYVFGDGATQIATSKDGRTFSFERDLEPRGYGTTAPVALDDGRLRLYAFEQGKPSGNAIVSFVSNDGLTWKREDGVRLAATADEQITDPYVVRWKGGFKMYFKSERRRAGDAAARGPGGPPPHDAQGRPNRGQRGPWDGDVVVRRVAADGAVETLATFERAGVPTVARLRDGRLVAAHQCFPADDDAAFDKVAARFSSDDGRTWTAPRVIGVKGLPEGTRFPFDPTLVPLPDGRVRLYFTSMRGRRFEESTPAIGSAISNDGVSYVVESGVRFAVEGRPVIDCAVVLADGVFHLYSPDNGAGSQPRGPDDPAPRVEDRPRSGTAYHATSNDGLAFKRQSDVHVDGACRWLGNALVEGTSIVFAGTQERGGLWTASSRDGATFTAPRDIGGVPGADPGAVLLKDGVRLLLTTCPRSLPPPAGQRPR